MFVGKNRAVKHGGRWISIMRTHLGLQKETLAPVCYYKVWTNVDCLLKGMDFAGLFSYLNSSGTLETDYCIWVSCVCLVLGNISFNESLTFKLSMFNFKTLAFIRKVRWRGGGGKWVVVFYFIFSYWCVRCQLSHHVYVARSECGLFRKALKHGMIIYSKSCHIYCLFLKG